MISFLKVPIKQIHLPFKSFRTLLRKAVCDSRIMVKAFCYAKRSIVKILLRKTAYSELCFAKWSSTTAFIFAVHKRQRSSLFLTAPFSSGCILVRSVLRNLSAHPSQRKPCDYGYDFCKAKVAMPPHCLVRSMKAAK